MPISPPLGHGFHVTKDKYDGVFYCHVNPRNLFIKLILSLFIMAFLESEIKTSHFIDLDETIMPSLDKIFFHIAYILNLYGKAANNDSF